MALKSYHKETLNDNWYEERASPLNGVLPHDRMKEYATTTGSDFIGLRTTPLRQAHLMIGDHNLDQAMRLTASTAHRDFRSAIPPPDLESQQRHLDSTHRTSFVNHFAHAAASHSATALSLVAAGGVGGRNVERGKAASGAMGEVFRVSAEPQKDTQAQRSWTYSTDPMIAIMRQRATQGPENVSPAPVSDKPGHFRRQSTSITTIPLSHKGVFADD